MAKNDKIKIFTEGPILPQIIKFAIPLMITGIMQLLFNTADTIMVGRWGGSTPEECETALAAVGSCGSLINLITLLFANLSLGAGVCVAHNIGAENLDGVKKTVHTSVVLSFIASAIVMPIGMFGARPLLQLMGTDPTVLDQAVPYMVAYFCGVPAKILYNYCAAILRSSGETVRPMRYLFAAGVINVLLNLIMVAVLKMGALGVGIATAVSLWVSCVMILIHMHRSDAPYHLDFRALSIDKNKLREILRIGIPAGIQGMVFSLSHVMIQSTVNSFGTAVVAGNAAAANLEGYAYQPMTSFYQAAVTFVGQHKGARKYKRMKKCILLSMGCVAVAGIIGGWLMVALGPLLLQLYIPGNEAAIDAGMNRMFICLVPYFLCGLMEVGSGVMRGMGRSTTSMITSLLGSVLFRIIWILFIFPLHPTLTMLYLSFPIAQLVTAIAHYSLAFFTVRKDQRLAEEEEKKRAQEEEKVAAKAQT